MFDMKRRDFMILLGAAAAWPRAARAQQSDRVRRVGVLMGIADDPEGRARVMVFRQALQALGWTEGRNVQFIYRWSRGDDRILKGKKPSDLAVQQPTKFDKTTLHVGPSSTVRLDKFVYDPNKGTKSVVIDATKGAFRFSTGAQGGGNVQVKTPHGTLGIRG